MTSQTQRPLPDNTQHPHATHSHALGGNRTRNPSKRAWADARLRLRLHWSQKRQNTTVKTDRRQVSRNQKHYCLCQRLHWNRYDWNVISPDCLAPTKFVPSRQSGQIPTAVRMGFWVSLQCSYKYGHACRIKCSHTCLRRTPTQRLFCCVVSVLATGIGSLSFQFKI